MLDRLSKLSVCSGESLLLDVASRDLHGCPRRNRLLGRTNHVRLFGNDLLLLPLPTNWAMQGSPRFVQPPRLQTVCVEDMTTLRRPARFIGLDDAEAYHAGGCAVSAALGEATLDVIWSQAFLPGCRPCAPPSPTPQVATQAQHDEPEAPCQDAQDRQDRQFFNRGSVAVDVLWAGQRPNLVGVVVGLVRSSASQTASLLAVRWPNCARGAVLLNHGTRGHCRYFQSSKKSNPPDCRPTQ